MNRNLVICVINAGVQNKSPSACGTPTSVKTEIFPTGGICPSYGLGIHLESVLFRNLFYYGNHLGNHYVRVIRVRSGSDKVE